MPTTNSWNSWRTTSSDSFRERRVRNELDASTARWRLKSPRSLSGTSSHPTIVKHSLMLWSWMIYSHLFGFMLVGPPIPGIRIFPTQCQGHGCGQSERSHARKLEESFVHRDKIHNKKWFAHVKPTRWYRSQNLLYQLREFWLSIVCVWKANSQQIKHRLVC